MTWSRSFNYVSSWRNFGFQEAIIPILLMKSWFQRLNGCINKSRNWWDQELEGKIIQKIQSTEMSNNTSSCKEREFKGFFSWHERQMEFKEMNHYGWFMAIGLKMERPNEVASSCEKESPFDNIYQILIQLPKSLLHIKVSPSIMVITPVMNDHDSPRVITEIRGHWLFLCTPFF